MGLLASRVAPPPQNVLCPPPGDVLAPQKATAVSCLVPITPKLGAQSHGAGGGHRGDMPRSGAPPGNAPWLRNVSQNSSKRRGTSGSRGRCCCRAGGVQRNPPPAPCCPSGPGTLPPSTARGRTAQLCDKAGCQHPAVPRCVGTEPALTAAGRGSPAAPGGSPPACPGSRHGQRQAARPRGAWGGAGGSVGPGGPGGCHGHRTGSGWASEEEERFGTSGRETPTPTHRLSPLGS